MLQAPGVGRWIQHLPQAMARDAQPCSHCFGNCCLPASFWGHLQRERFDVFSDLLFFYCKRERRQEKPQQTCITSLWLCLIQLPGSGGHHVPSPAGHSCSAGGTGTIATVHISPARGLPAYVQVLNARSAFHASLLTAAHWASPAQKYAVIVFFSPPVFPALLLPTIFSSMVHPGLVGSLSCKTFLLPLFAVGGFIFKKGFLISPCLWGPATLAYFQWICCSLLSAPVRSERTF